MSLAAAAAISRSSRDHVSDQVVEFGGVEPARLALGVRTWRELESGQSPVGDRTLDEIRYFGVTQIRQLVYWQDFAPRPKAKRKPHGFNAADPDLSRPYTWVTASTR